jgi:hypothetical protein
MKTLIKLIFVFGITCVLLCLVVGMLGCKKEDRLRCRYVIKVNGVVESEADAPEVRGDGKCFRRVSVNLTQDGVRETYLLCEEK